MSLTLGSYGQPSIDQHDAKFIAASDAVFRTKGVRVSPTFIKAVMGLESRENGNYPLTACRVWDGHPGPRSCGPMQIKWLFHQRRCPQCDQTTLAGHIELATHIIGDTMLEYGYDEYRAYTKAYLTSDDINGTTQAAAVAGLRRRVRDMERDANGPVAAVPRPPPVVPDRVPPDPVADPIAVIVGTTDYTADYGWLSDVGLSYYHFGVGHGTTRPTQHTGLDVPLVCGGSLYTPAAGVVDCVGALGTPRWGQACGAYADVDGGGVGNVTILLDGGVKLTLGHCRGALVKPGQRVTAGQQVATVGSQNGCHVHIETSVERQGSYWLVEPRAALAPLLTPPDPHAGLVKHLAIVAGDISGQRLTIPIYLPPDVKFTIKLTPRGQPNRTGQSFQATKTIWHETGNPRPTADAMDHAIWQSRGAPQHPDGPVSVTFYVDDGEIVQCLPLNERGIHAGDARNGTSWGVERCVNQGIDHAKAERNAAALHATLLRDVLGTTVAAMEPHTTSGCPATINQAKRWSQIVADVARVMSQSSTPGQAPPTFSGLSIPETVFLALWQNPKVQPDPTQPFTRWIIANKHWHTVSALVREGDESYLVTGGGLLRYQNGKVEKL